jgi:hypothetical protein
MLATRRCQTGATDLQEINVLCKNTIETESRPESPLTTVEAEARRTRRFEKIVAEIRNFSKDLDYLKNKHSENQR